MKLQKQFRRMAHVKCERCGALLLSFLVRAKWAAQMLTCQDGNAALDLVLDKSPLDRTLSKVRPYLERAIAAHRCQGTEVPA